nr:alpha/beta hydrolase [Burkholderia sp. L27(2015)]
MVMLHELGGSLESWDEAIEPLVADFTILRLDQRGHGGSEKVREPMTLEQLADDLDMVLIESKLPQPYWLVAAAAGAAVALIHALRYPERVAGMVLCAPALEADAARRTYLEQRSDLAVNHGMRAIEAATLDRSYPVALRQRGGAARFETYRARFLGNDPVAYGLANRALGSAQLRDGLARSHVACLMVAGTHDPLRPPLHVAELAALWGDPQRVEFAELDCGHLVAVQAPDELARMIIDFVQRQEENGDVDGLASSLASGRAQI